MAHLSCLAYGAHLVPKRDSHDRDQDSKEQLQFSQSVLVQKYKCQRIDDRDDNSAPKWESTETVIFKCIYNNV